MLSLLMYLTRIAGIETFAKCYVLINALFDVSYPHSGN